MKEKRKHFNIPAPVLTFIVFIMWMQINHIHAINKMRLARKKMQYVLQWTSPSTQPFVFMGKGQETFIKNNCSNINCFITSDRNFLTDIKEFDVILFDSPELFRKGNLTEMPISRSTDQSYIYSGIESSAYYPVDKTFNNFFNYTWTYKLSSDLYYGYIAIKNKNGEVVGPRIDVDWINVDDMLQINETLKMMLANKKIAAAWFVSNCHSRSGREHFILPITKEMEKYNMTLDIYGGCGSKKCPLNIMKDCLNMIKWNYYFYFSFENSLAGDYVTEKLLHALQNYAIPVVFGGANYTRFMPTGIYLNVLELSIKQLVLKMFELINNKSSYYNYFKWHNHYSYHSLGQSSDTDHYCKFCDYINNQIPVNRKRTIRNLAEWWNSYSQP